MEDFPPCEFSLPGKIRADHAFMKSSPLCILGSVRLIKCVLVREQDNLNSIFVGRERFHFEGPVLRDMKAKHMPLPAF